MEILEILILALYVLVILFSIIVHEVSHGVVANALGDPTAKYKGRLTLNPLKHLDFFGSFLLPILLIISKAGFIFGYAKPVPYNPNNLSDRKYGRLKVSLAGPLSNITLAFCFGLLLRYMPASLELTLVPEMFELIVLVNLALAVFNLLPIPPLDGHEIILTLLPNKFIGFKLLYARYGHILFFAFIFSMFFNPRLLYPVIRTPIAFLFELIVGASLVI